MIDPKNLIVPAKQQPIKTIIFDLKDVLFQTSRTQSAMIPLDLYTILQQVPAQTNNNTAPMYHANKLLPQIIVDWLVGRKSHDALHETLTWLAKNALYSDEKNILYTPVIQWLFNPPKYIQTMDPIKPMHTLAYNFKAQGYKLYILSNWDTESFPLLTQKYPHFFNIFDGIMISGTEGIGKPNPRFYQKLLQKYDIDPTKCIFIDDEPHNVTAAYNLGIHGILYDSFESALHQLKKTGVMK